MVWKTNPQGGIPKGCLIAHDGEWEQLAQAADVIACLAVFNGKGLTPGDFCTLLEDVGYEDFTVTVNPHL